jgi:hypothetical protein
MGKRYTFPQYVFFFLFYYSYFLPPQHALELLNASQQRGGATFCFRNEVGRVQRALESAKKDNDFIYHDKIPDVKTLATIGKAAIAKPTPVSTPLSPKFQGMSTCNLCPVFCMAASIIPWTP